MKDVARLAGVSASTVSRVINHTIPVDEATRLKAESVLPETNFKPNLLARGLQSKSGNLIGLIIPEILHQRPGQGGAAHPRPRAPARGRDHLLAGLVGAGRTEIMQLIYGYRRKDAGRIFLKGKELRIRRTRDAVRKGIALIPEERKKQALAPPRSTCSPLTAPLLRC